MFTKLPVVVVFGISCVTVTLAAQEPRSAVEQRAVEVAAQAGAVARVAVETRVTRGSPYSAEALTEFVQPFADGNRIVRQTRARLFRDGEGRTRREEGTDEVVITDPVAGHSFILETQSRVATG